MARFRHRRFNAKRMIRSENDSVLLPMARFGIELIAKKDGHPSQNDFALSVSMARFGIESIAKKDGYPSQNDFALSASMARFRHRRFNAKRMIRSENDSVLLPMAHFGIELIAKKDGYPSQNDFALSPKGTD